MSLAVDLPPAARRDITAACERLSLDYSHYADTGRREAWAALFAEDAEMHLSGQVHRGREAIAAIAGASGAASLHVVGNIRIDVLSEEDAEGTVYVTAYMKAADGPAATSTLTPAAVGVYRDVYRRTTEGWRFAKRSFEPFLVRG
jgi:hypothetical protein